MKNEILKIAGENRLTMGVAPVERLTSPLSADHVIGMKKGYPETGTTTCHNCRIVCWKSKADRLENYRIVHSTKM